MLLCKALISVEKCSMILVDDQHGHLIIHGLPLRRSSMGPSIVVATCMGTHDTDGHGDVAIHEPASVLSGCCWQCESDVEGSQINISGFRCRSRRRE